MGITYKDELNADYRREYPGADKPIVRCRECYYYMDYVCGKTGLQPEPDDGCTFGRLPVEDDILCNSCVHNVVCITAKTPEMLRKFNCDHYMSANVLDQQRRSELGLGSKFDRIPCYTEFFYNAPVTCEETCVEGGR